MRSRRDAKREMWWNNDDRDADLKPQKFADARVPPHRGVFILAFILAFSNSLYLAPAVIPTNLSRSYRCATIAVNKYTYSPARACQISASTVSIAARG